MAEPTPSHSPASSESAWPLPDSPDLAWLRKQAKRLRRRLSAGEPDALALLEALDPRGGPAADVTLARAQLVLARRHGFGSWRALVAHVEGRAAATRPMAGPDDAAAAADTPVEAFLRLACLTYTEPAAADAARRLLDADPALATASAVTLAACGRAEQLAGLLDVDPGAVGREDGPHRWPPLLHLCYSRLGLGEPVATMRVLLERGADPHAGFLWKGLPSPFTGLTGVLGGGERCEPPHREAVELATLLLDAGADPNDNQAFYNRQFRADDSHLPPLLAHGAGVEVTPPSPWRARLGDAYPSAPQMLGEHLRTAAQHGFAARVRTLLAHGVDPLTRGYHPALGDQTPYEVAMRHGHLDVAALLADAGGASDRLDDADRLLAAALGGDLAVVAELGPRVPDLPARRPDAVRLAGEQHDADAVERLLALGYTASAPGRDGVTALHEAALRGDIDLCRWLLARGADPGAVERRFGATAAGWATHGGHPALAAELAAPDNR